MGPKGAVFRFDDVRVEAGEFRVYKSEAPVALEPKAFSVLLFLLENSGRLVSRDELLDAVWRDAFVTPNVLTRAVAQLRRKLGDGCREPRYIQTVPTRGYRFIAGVRRSGRRSRPDRHPPERTIAVLPFRFLGGDAGRGQLGLGLADALITRLSRIGGLSVRPTSSVMRYLDATTAGAAGRELKVEMVVDGTVQVSGEDLRVSVRLVRTADEKTIWAGGCDTRLGDLFRTQDEVSERLSEALTARLPGRS